MKEKNETYRVGSIDTRRGGYSRPLIRESDDQIIAWIQENLGPALLGSMTEKKAKQRYPEAFRDLEAESREYYRSLE